MTDIQKTYKSRMFKDPIDAFLKCWSSWSSAQDESLNQQAKEVLDKHKGKYVDEPTNVVVHTIYPKKVNLRLFKDNYYLDIHTDRDHHIYLAIASDEAVYAKQNFEAGQWVDLLDGPTTCTMNIKS